MTTTEVASAASWIGQVPRLAARYGQAFARDSLVRWATAICIALLTVLLILPAIVPWSPTELNAGAPLAPPSADHPFGTDQVGRDVAARVLHGARLSMLVAAASALAALMMGSVLGAAAATGPRWLSELVMRVMDVGLAFPGILLAIVLAAAIGPSMTTTIVVLGVIFTPPMARVVRAAVLAEYEEDYVTAARLLGTGPFRLVAYHIGVNAALPILVYVTLIMAAGIIAEAGLSFLGAGIRPPAPSWGNILSDGQSVVQAGAWWVSMFPGLAIMITVLGLNRFSEALGRRLRSR